MRRNYRSFVAVIIVLLYSTSVLRAQTLDAADVTVAKPDAVTTGLSPSLQSLDEISTDDLTAAVGKGYDPIEDRILPTVCVIPKSAPIVLEPRTDATVFFNLTKNVKENQSASQTSIGFGALIKTVSLGFGHSDVESNYFNSVDGFGRIRARIAVKGKMLDAIQWSNKDEVRNALRNPKEFFNKCGTKFVRAVYSGQLLDEWVKSTLRQDKTTATDANALSVGISKVFSLSAGTADASSRVNCFADTTLQFHGLGALALPPIGGAPGGAAASLTAPGTGPAGPPVPPQTPASPPLPAGPEDCAVISSTSALQGLINYYNSGFRSAVAHAAIDTAVPLYVTLDDYNDPDVQLPSTKAIPAWINQLVLVVNNYTENYYDLVGAISDLDYALTQGPFSRLDAFYNVQPETDNSTSPPKKLTSDEVAARKLKQAKAMLAKFKDALIECRNYAKGPENVGGKSAVSLCQDKLEASISNEQVVGVLIKRKYK